MARANAWGRAVGPLILLLACSTQRSSESQSSYAQKVDTVTEEGSWTVRTWEFAPLGAVEVPPQSVGGATGRRSTAGEASRLPTTPVSVSGSVVASTPFLPAGELLRYTEETHEPTTIHSDSAVQASGSAEAESKSRPFGIFALLAAGWPFLLGACGAAALVILRPPWLIAGWSLVKSLFGKGK